MKHSSTQTHISVVKTIAFFSLIISIVLSYGFYLRNPEPQDRFGYSFLLGEGLTIAVMIASYVMMLFKNEEENYLWFIAINFLLIGVIILSCFFPKTDFYNITHVLGYILIICLQGGEYLVRCSKIKKREYTPKACEYRY